MNWAQLHSTTPGSTNAQQATQPNHISQGSQGGEPAEISDGKPAESEREVPTAWMSDLVQELINTQESE